MNSSRHLSKTRLLNGRQCPKRLWLEVNDPEQAQISAATENAFAIGHQAGAAAQALFPDGVLIRHDQELSAAIAETAERLAEPVPVALFEATFSVNGVLIRADVLRRDSAGRLRLIEVKASTSLKDYHLFDCAVQLWVLEQLGWPVTAVELAHINNQFVYAGDGDYSGLFSFVDVLPEARQLQPQVPQLLAQLQAVLEGPEPAIEMGAQCTSPYDCPFIDHCIGPLPPRPVSWLPGGRRLHAKLRAEGMHDLGDIPEGSLGDSTRERVRRISLAGEPELLPGAAEELGRLGWPRYYFDFETLAPVVPVFAGTRPYEKQAFQWSCHVEYAYGRLEHREFLADGEAPPMRACAEALLDALGEHGPVFMYSSYERTVLNQLRQLYPDLDAPLAAVCDRLYDLHPLTRRHYYHPDMRGSWSIKAVLPTVAPELSYAGLSLVSVGTDAEVAYLEMIDPQTPATRAEALREALLRYCKLDTEAMVRLAWFLEGRAPA